LLGYQSLTKGLSKLEINKKKVEADLLANWNILSEAAQTVARKKGDNQAYEKIAGLSKQKQWGQKEWQQLAQEIDPLLSAITSYNYLGLSASLAKKVTAQTYQLIKEIQS
jgi:adenylosuccinate lyase